MPSIINADNGVASGSVGLKYASDNSGVLALQTNGNTAVTIDATGNIGVGTSLPGSGVRLDVLGGEIRAGRVDTSSEGGQVSFSRSTDNATAWYLDVYGNTSTPSFRVVDVGAGAVSLAVNSSGAVALRGGVSASGVGITFPSTQVASSDANTLDDYEEGTWTPQIGTDGSQPTVTYSSQNGRYTKIGNQVTVEAYVQWTGTSGGSGGAVIKNLPFTANAYTPDSRGFSYIFGWNGVTYTGVLASVLQAGDTYTILYSNSSGSIGSLPLSSVSSGGALRFIFSYQTVN
jgi:hypothetical protein